MLWTYVKGCDSISDCFGGVGSYHDGGLGVCGRLAGSRFVAEMVWVCGGVLRWASFSVGDMAERAGEVLKGFG